MTTNLESIDEKVFKGLVLDNKGMWRPLDEVVALEQDTIAHCLNGEIYHNGQWVPLDTLREDVGEDAPVQTGGKGRRMKRPVSVDAGETSLLDVRPADTTQDAGPAGPQADAVVNGDKGDCETRRIVVNVPGSGSGEAGEDSVLSSGAPPQEVLLDVDEFSGLIDALENSDADMPDRDMPDDAVEVENRAAVVQQTIITGPEPLSRPESEDEWNRARSRSAKIIVGAGIAAALAVAGILLSIYLF